MPLINQALPNLIGGVSQQPDVTRFEGQCEAQENALSSVVDGLSKRPQTKHIKQLLVNGADLGAISDNSFVHFINRTAQEKYVIFYDVTTHKLHAYNLDGTEATINGALGGKQCTVSEYLYITQDTDLRALTVGDSTFLLNKTKSIALGSTTSPALAKEAGVFIKQGDFSKEYAVDINYLGATSGSTQTYSAVPARITVELENYLYSNTNGNRTRRWRVKGNPTVTHAGSGHNPSTTVISLTSNGAPSTGNVNRREYNTRHPSFTTYPTITTGDTAGTLSSTESTNNWKTWSSWSSLNSSTNHINNRTTINTTNPAQVYTPATFSFTVNSSGAVQSVTTTNVGDYAGIGFETYEDPAGDDPNNYYYGVLPANLSINISGVTSSGGDLSAGLATITSGGSTDGNNASTQTIAGTLATQLVAKEGTVPSPNNTAYKEFDTTSHGAGAFILLNRESTYVDTSTIGNQVKANLGDWDISTTDGLANTGLQAIYKKVPSITDLPVYCKNGFRVKIVGDAEVNADDYYVKFETQNGADFGQGVWVEDIGYGVTTDINGNTLPQQLIRTNENTFTLGAMNIDTRKVGDDISNPMPSFIGKRLSGMFRFKNRIGFLCEDNVIMTEAGLGSVSDDGTVNFNFFRTTVTTVLDSDPIDIAVSSSKYTDLKAAVGFQENLILFSENTQFALKGGDLLTPSSVSVAPLTNFDSNGTSDPVAIGSYIYFGFNRGNHTGIREFTVNANTDNYDATEITEHVPTYIPKDIKNLTGSTAENIIVAKPDGEPKTLYIYNYFWSGAKKLQGAWSKLIMPFNVIGYGILDSNLFLIGTKESKTHLLSMPLQSGLKDTGMNYNTYLDMRKEHTLSNATAVPLGFTASIGDRVQVWDDEGQSLHDQTLTSTATSVTLGTAHTGKVFSGIVYTMKYVFSEQVFKQQAGNSKAPSGFTRAQIRNGALFFNDTRGFKVKVQPDNRDETTHTFTPTLIGTSSVGNIELESGNFRFPVFTDAQGTTITVENDSALPANFSSAEFETFVHERSKRFG